jgi:hypothetical protein
LQQLGTYNNNNPKSSRLAWHGLEDPATREEVYGLGSEDRWRREMHQDGSTTVRCHSCKIGRNEYLVVKKIKTGKRRLPCERKRKWLLKEEEEKVAVPFFLSLWKEEQKQRVGVLWNTAKTKVEK